jgi:tRNA U34 5-methylaminomethyl-2-thiouridine-forming methyltransferase MnmC
MVEFGFGFLLGAITFDQLWRYVNRLTEKTRVLNEEIAAVRANPSPDGERS